MNTITKVYKSKFKEVLSPYGFRTFRNSFYRIVNDVVQVIRLDKSADSCTIEFNIWPLSEGIVDLSSWRGYNISELRSGKVRGRHWQFEKFSQYAKNRQGIYETLVADDGDIEDIVDDMLLVITSCVVPIFEKAIDCNSALEEIKKHDIYVYGEKIAAVYDSRRHWWYIKIGNYEKAMQGLTSIIEQHQSALDTNLKKFDRLVQIEVRREYIDYYTLQYELAKSNDPVQTRLDMLSNENLPQRFREHLLSEGWEIAFSVGNPSIAKRQIRDFERALKELMDENSSYSKELIDTWRKCKERADESIEQYSNLVKLLSIPDRAYFHKIISQNELQSQEYFASPSKNKAKI